MEYRAFSNLVLVNERLAPLYSTRMLTCDVLLHTFVVLIVSRHHGGRQTSDPSLGHPQVSPNLKGSMAIGKIAIQFLIPLDYVQRCQNLQRIHQQLQSVDSLLAGGPPIDSSKI
jgi:hypothetical protein